MTAFAALFRRELLSRWPAVAASLAMGCLLVAVPFAAGPSSTSPSELRGIAAAVVLATWGALLAVLVGTTLFSREIGGGSFALRQPAAALLLWAARLVAALVLQALCAIVVLLPSLPFGLDLAALHGALASPLPDGALDEPVALALIFALVWTLLLLLANAFAVALRARGAWATLDLASTTILAAGIFAAWRELREANAPGALWLPVAATALLLLPGLLVASARQLTQGRGESDRTQRAHALALLVASGLAAAGTSALARGYARPTLSDLAPEYADVEPIGGSRVIAGGPVVNRVRMRADFLLDLATGESVRLRPRPGMTPVSAPRGSIDGRRFGWFEVDWSAREPRAELILFDAERPATAELTAIPGVIRPQAWALSPDAARVAVVDWRRRLAAHVVEVTQVQPPATLRSLAVQPCDSVHELRFPAPSRLSVDCQVASVEPGEGEPARLVHEIDLDTGEIAAGARGPSADRLGEVVAIAGGGEWRSVRRSAARACRLLAREIFGQTTLVQLALFDESTSELRRLQGSFWLVRDPRQPEGLVLLGDSNGNWRRFDPADCELHPLFADGSYGRGAQLHGW